MHKILASEIAEFATLDYGIWTIMADGQDWEIEADVECNVCLMGEKSGSICVTGDSHAEAIRGGSGNGTSVRLGGPGNSIRCGGGDGHAVKYGTQGHSRRSGTGHGHEFTTNR